MKEFNIPISEVGTVPAWFLRDISIVDYSTAVFEYRQGLEREAEQAEMKRQAKQAESKARGYR